jgi:hypothetical protein
MRAKPAVPNDAPRSEVNTKADRFLFALEPPQRPQLVAENRMGAGRALLDSTNVQGCGFEVDLIPA